MIENIQTILNLKLLNINVKLNKLDLSSLNILSNMFNFNLKNNTSKNIIENLIQKFKTLNEKEIDQVIDILDDTLININKQLETPELKKFDNENISEIHEEEESINSQNIDKKLKTLHLDNRSFKRKRNYHQMLEVSKSLQTIDSRFIMDQKKIKYFKFTK